MLIFVMHVRIDLHECVFADVDRCLITVVIRTHRGYYMRLYFQIFGDALFLHLSLSCQMLAICHHAMFLPLLTDNGFSGAKVINSLFSFPWIRRACRMDMDE